MPSLIEIRRIWENGRAFVIVRSSFNSDLVRDFHRHRKATWDPIQKHWKFLFSEPFLSGLVSKYGKRIDADLAETSSFEDGAVAQKL